MPQINRTIGEEEARKMLSVERASEIDRERKEVGKWPGHYNLKLLAQAVSDRKLFVAFLNNERFAIRYDDDRKAVFIRPDTEKFVPVPCGWWTYESLKLILDQDENY